MVIKLLEIFYQMFVYIKILDRLYLWDIAQSFLLLKSDFFEICIIFALLFDYK